MKKNARNFILIAILFAIIFFYGSRLFRSEIFSSKYDKEFKRSLEVKRITDDSRGN